MHQCGMYGAWYVVARGSSPLRTLYKLWRAAASRTATAGATAAASSPHAEFVSSVSAKINNFGTHFTSHKFLPALGVKMAHGFRRGPLLHLE